MPPSRDAPSPAITHIAGAQRPPDGEYDADVVILALDRADDTVAAIHSAIGQSGVSRHVVILDQGSTAANLARLAETVACHDEATLLRSSRNLGVAEGRNIASAFGHGRVIVGLDNDAEFATTDTVADLVAALDDDPFLAAVGCRIVRFRDGRDDPTSWGYPRSLLPRSADTFLAATFVGAGHAIRREAWDDVGGYDPTLFFCWEEYDFCLRAIVRGWRIRYRGDLIVRHKVNAEQRIAWTGTRRFHYVRNRLYIERQSGAGWLALLPRALGYWLKGLRAGQATLVLRAIAAAMRMPRRAGNRPLTPSAKDYLRQHDTVYRGSWFRRLSVDCFASTRTL